MTREEAKHIDAFKYWCETNEEMGVITIPKFICDHIVEILDNEKARPHGEWLPCTFTDKRTGETVNFTIGSVIMMTCSACNKDAFAGGNFCPNCGTPMISSNSETEKSKSEIVPDYRDGWRLKEGADMRESKNCDNCFLSAGEQCDILVPSENCKHWKPFPQ